MAPEVIFRLLENQVREYPQNQFITAAQSIKVAFFSKKNVSYLFFQASRDIAPILVCAPHATFVDAIAILVSKALPVAKKALGETIFIGSVGKCMQVLFVSREQVSSRKNIISQIKVKTKIEKTKAEKIIESLLFHRKDQLKILIGLKFLSFRRELVRMQKP